MEFPEVKQTDQDKYKNYDEAIRNVNKRDELLYTKAIKSMSGRDFMALEILKVMIQTNLKVDSEIYKDSIYIAERMIKELYPVLKKTDRLLFFDRKDKYKLAKNETECNLFIKSGWVDVSQSEDHRRKAENVLWENI